MYRDFTPQPSFPDTLPDTASLDLADLLSTEAQAEHDAEQLAYVQRWIKQEGN